ncbi:hypothetical protein ACFQDN_20835 [Pseudomonas asuensis]|uniref:Uncharacterized protein n=1 Tax=Pseudomonas asuensis TaxID=1825787 RepID=A0ABQ2H3U4_9PSED|nr:hypothetical protein [Pseudomonas asuensis]GGM29798.1 hypothetical protein GCM10009425_45450 [Pseudomonas asuensis]
MFKTNRNAELLPGLSNDPAGVQFWSFVEQEIAWPWFYLQLVEVDGQEIFRSMLMVPTIPLLEQIVAVKTDNAWIEQALLVSPSSLNKTGRWMMEPLVEVCSIRNEQDRELGYVYRVEGPKTYSTLDFLVNEPLKTCTIFSAELHLPN